jgi:hypothetical protein
MSQSSEFCRHYPLCCLSTSVDVVIVVIIIIIIIIIIISYRLCPETFGYTLAQLYGMFLKNGDKVTFNLSFHDFYISKMHGMSLLKENLSQDQKFYWNSAFEISCHSQDMKNGQKIINNYFLSTRVTHRRK